MGKRSKIVLLPFTLIMFFASCNNLQISSHAFHTTGNLSIKNLFPGKVTSALAIDTPFIFKYAANHINKLKITLKLENRKITYTEEITSSGILKITNPFNRGGKFQIIFSPLPEILRCNNKCHRSNLFNFFFSLANSKVAEPLKAIKIKPCQRCNFISDNYTIFFNKPVSSSTSFFLKKAGIPNSEKNFNTLTIFSLAVTIPAWIKDIYGMGLTEAIIIKPYLPCLHIKEICTNPHNDWSDSRGGDHIPYNNKPGHGTINATDQFVMVKNECHKKFDPELLYLSVCNNYGCNYQSLISRNRKNNNFIIFGDPPGTLEGGETIKLNYEKTIFDIVKIPDTFSPKGGWWRNATTYKLTETFCTIP